MILRFLRRQMPFYLDTGLNLVHVRDVVEGHLLAWKQGRTGDRYILGHENLSLKTLLEMLAELTGLSAPQGQLPYWLPLSVAWMDERVLSAFGKRPSVPIAGVQMARQKMYYDASKAVRELGLPNPHPTSPPGSGGLVYCPGVYPGGYQRYQSWWAAKTLTAKLFHTADKNFHPQTQGGFIKVKAWVMVGIV